MHHYNWDRSHEALDGLAPIDRACKRASQTPLRDEISDAYDPATERTQVWHYAVETASRSLK